MDYLSLSIVLIVIGIPAIIGSYNIAANFGKKSVRDNAAILVYAAGVAAAFAIVLPQGSITTGKYLIKSPGAFAVCILIGGVAGLLSRLFGR